MKLFNSFFNKGKKGIQLYAPTTGQVIPLSQVNDPTFKQELIGKGVAILPSSSQIYAPCDGVITTLFRTHHALILTTDEGLQILIHIGLDTVKLNGKGFTLYVEEGQKVKQGTLLMHADLRFIKEKGYDPTIPMVICNSEDFETITPLTIGAVNISHPILRVTLK